MEVRIFFHKNKRPLTLLLLEVVSQAVVLQNSKVSTYWKKNRKKEYTFIKTQRTRVAKSN